MSKHSSRSEEYKRIRLYVLERDGGLCQLGYPGICLTDADTADHVIPRELGGTDDPGNLVAACQPCNRRKSNKLVTRATWHNPRWFTIQQLKSLGRRTPP